MGGRVSIDSDPRWTDSMIWVRPIYKRRAFLFPVEYWDTSKRRAEAK